MKKKNQYLESSVEDAARRAATLENKSDLSMLASAAFTSDLNNNSGSKAAAAVLEAVNSGSAMRMAAATIEAMNHNSGSKAAAAALEAMNSGSALRMAAAVIKAWNDQESPLLAYLASNTSPNLSQLVQAAGVARARAVASGKATVVRVKPALEGEIVDLLCNGNTVEQLPQPAMAHLLECVWYLYHAAKYFVLVVAVWQAVDFVKDKLLSVQKPTEIRQILEQLPQEQLELLTGYRVLIRDRVILRSLATKQSDVLGRPQIGTLMEVLEEGEAWIKVSVEIFGEMKEGWIYRSYTAPIQIPRKRI